jgi:tetratricopeptide (TPR) repeat protein
MYCRENDEVMNRIRSAKGLIQMGTHSSNSVAAENILHEACDLLECWVKEFEEDEKETDGNPFITLQTQARHRLAEISLQQGNLALASQLFLQVIEEDPETLSPQARAMTWYDVGLIYIAYGCIPQAQAALGKSFATLMQHDQQQGGGTGADETLLYYIHQAMLRLVELFEQKVSASQAPPLLWSSQFTLVSYNYGRNEQQIAGEEVSRGECYQLVMDASLCHARAA